jgi:hypothetical protein
VEESGSYEPVDTTSSFSIIGNAVDALLIFINRSEYKSYDSFWGRYSHGTYRTGGKFSNIVPTHTGNATDLVIGNLTFFRIETDLGTRILFLDPTSQVPGFFNTAYPRAHYGASARLIRSNDHLVLIEGGYFGYPGQGNIVGRVRVLSVPR